MLTYLELISRPGSFWDTSVLGCKSSSTKMYVSCCHDSNIYPCFVHDRLVYQLATPTSFLKTDKPVIKSISDEAIISNKRLSISETFWFRLINSILQNRLLLNSPPLQMNALHIFHPGHHVKESICVWPSLFCLTITLCREYFITRCNQVCKSTFSLVTLQMTGCHMQVISYLEAS